MVATEIMLFLEFEYVVPHDEDRRSDLSRTLDYVFDFDVYSKSSITNQYTIFEEAFHTRRMSIYSVEE